jgi:hypothetical protein
MRCQLELNVRTLTVVNVSNEDPLAICYISRITINDKSMILHLGDNWTQNATSNASFERYLLLYYSKLIDFTVFWKNKNFSKVR